jgi:hypothetical protein
MRREETRQLGQLGYEYGGLSFSLANNVSSVDGESSGLLVPVMIVSAKPSEMSLTKDMWVEAHASIFPTRAALQNDDNPEDETEVNIPKRVACFFHVTTRRFCGCCRFWDGRVRPRCQGPSEAGGQTLELESRAAEKMNQPKIKSRWKPQCNSLLAFQAQPHFVYSRSCIGRARPLTVDIRRDHLQDVAQSQVELCMQGIGNGVRQ